MGSLTLPAGGTVYVDAMVVIYTVELYARLLAAPGTIVACG
jgi:hypothetical protein